MAKLWRKGTDGQPQEVDLATLSITSPTVIFLPGHLTRDYRPDIVATGLVAFETMLQDDAKPLPQIYVWSYTHTQKFSHLTRYRLFPNHTARPSAKNVARGVLLPLVSDADGKPLPLATAKKNLRNITFVGHSAGNIFAEEVFNAAFGMMKKMGYAKAEARDVLSEVVNVSLGTVAKAVNRKKRFSSVYMTNTDDLYIRGKNRIFHPLKSIFNRFTHRRPLKIRQVTPNSLLVTAAAHGKWRQRHKDVREKGIDIILPRRDIRHTNHGFYNYVTEDSSTSQIAHIASSAVVSSLGRDSDFTVTDLLTPRESLGAAEKAVYESRIAKARGLRR